ncbi:MAG: ComEC/Rec2 family competence protein [bacterium]|nr:ComEC/Rec2 family competence protein [bacterium]
MKKILQISIPLILSFFLSNCEFFEPTISHQVDLLRVTFIDVWQGDSILIEVPGGEKILIDAGRKGTEDFPFDAGEERVLPLLQDKKIKHLSHVILTHPHSDHVGGLIAVLKNIKVSQVLDPGIPHPTPVYEEFLKLIEEKDIPYRIIRRGDDLSFGENIEVTVLNPPRDLYEGESMANNNSLVIKMKYGDISFLFTGDIEEEQLEELITIYGEGLKSEILKVPHHGSVDGNPLNFIEIVSPEVAIISCGSGNRFGHPHKETLERYKRQGSKIYRTDLDGNIEVSTDGVRYWVR